MKRGNSPNIQKRLKKQLERGQTFISENLPFDKKENWKFVKAVCIGKIAENICDDCKPFVLDSDATQNCIETLKKKFIDLWSITSKSIKETSNNLVASLT